MTAFTAVRKSARLDHSVSPHPEPPALVLDEPSCYHFCVLDRLCCEHSSGVLKDETSYRAATRSS
jgi:hypothetical protein